MAGAESVAAAVAHVGDEGRGEGGVDRRNDKQGYERGAHTAVGAGSLCLAVDGLIGDPYGLEELGARRDKTGGRGCEALQEGVARQLTGDLAGSCAPHAVADNEGTALGVGPAGVLVDGADASEVRSHSERDHGVRRNGGAGERGHTCTLDGGRCFDIGRGDRLDL